MGDGLPPYAQKMNPIRAMKMIPNKAPPTMGIESFKFFFFLNIYPFFFKKQS